jgi:DNA-binding NtrC family response regulator
MSRRLLIVDDDEALRRMLGWELEDLGYEVSLAGDCREGLALASRRRFDLALLDYRLPDGSGIELMESLRTLSPGLPVVLCSGLAGSDTQARALREGAASFLTKPASAALLDRAFRSALSQCAERV